MSMRQTGGSMRYSEHGSSANHSSDFGSGGKKRLAGYDRILFLLIAVGFIAFETFYTPQDNIVTPAKPLEQSYVFNTLEECLAKQAKLKTQHKSIKGLRCVPNGDIN